VILDYHDGQHHYEVTLSGPVPSQQVRVIDIKQLRDQRVADKNGTVLPADLTEGSASVFAGHGALVVSDPIFMFAADELTQPSRELVSPSNGGQGESAGGEGDPFFAPSCPGNREPPPPPRPRVKFLKIWINAFIPQNIPGQTEIMPTGGGTMLRPACVPPLAADIHFCFETDNRGFSSYVHASSRMHSEITIDLETGLSVSQWHNCDCTLAFSCEQAQVFCSARASTEMMNFPTIVSAQGGNDIEVFLDGSAADPCVPLASLFARIRYRGSFSIDVPRRFVSFNGEISEFPAYEAYVSADNGPAQLIFATPPLQGITACDIPAAPLRPQTGQAFY
jgi:hypothetical protein